MKVEFGSTEKKFKSITKPESVKPCEEQHIPPPQKNGWLNVNTEKGLQTAWSGPCVEIMGINVTRVYSASTGFTEMHLHQR